MLLRPLSVFLCFFIGAVLLGALLSYPFYILVNVFYLISFEDLLSKTILLSGLIISLAYLQVVDKLTLKSLALQTPGLNYSVTLVKSFLGGVIIFVFIAINLLLMGIYELDTSRDLGLTILIKLLLSALLTGFAVALIEETIFRGALFSGLSIQTNTIVALIITSVCYAAVHFIHFPSISSIDSLNWYSGLHVFPWTFNNLLDVTNFDALVTLLVLGLLFALVRIRTKSIVQCIGLHAGIVSAVKISKYLTNYSPETQWAIFVNSHNHHLGYIATLWLLVILAAYYFLSDNRAV